MKAKIASGLVAIILAAQPAFSQPTVSVRPPSVVAIVPNPPSSLVLPTRSPPPTAEDIAKGQAVAELLNGEATMQLVFGTLFDDTMPKVLAADSNFQRIEKDHPGLGKALLAAMRPIMMKYLKNQMPGIRKDLGALFSDAMTSSELDATLAFYRSPTGTKTIKTMAKKVDGTSILERMANNRNYPVVGSDLSQAEQQMARVTVNELNQTEQAESAQFSVSQAGRKLLIILPLMNQMSITRLNASHPDLNAELKIAMQAETKKFLSTTPK